MKVCNKTLRLIAAVLALGQLVCAADTIQGRWKLLRAEDVRDNGEVVRLPWGEHPVGSIVVQNGWCYLQIMSSDTPAFTGTNPIGEQMQRKLASSYISYSGACTFDDAAGTISLKIDAAWRPAYVGTEQHRIYHFDRGKLIFGTTAGSIRMGSERLTRRLTLERAP